jgi:hypothetical protein
LGRDAVLSHALQRSYINNGSTGPQGFGAEEEVTYLALDSETSTACTAVSSW